MAPKTMPIIAPAEKTRQRQVSTPWVFSARAVAPMALTGAKGKGRRS